MIKPILSIFVALLLNDGMKLFAVHAFMLLDNDMPKDQNPNDGDQLLCYDMISWFQSVGCLAATATNGYSEADDRDHAAGELYRTSCSKRPEEYWIVNKDNGIQTLRLKNDPTQCLTFDKDQPLVRLAPCNPKELGQKIEFNNWTKKSMDTDPDYNYFYIYNSHAGNSLAYDLKYNRMIKNTSAILGGLYVSGLNYRFFCDNWVWVSEVEKKAKASRNISFDFPIRGLTNPQRDQYAYGFVEQMMHSTSSYPKVGITMQSPPESPWIGRSGTCDRGNCFPIDYLTLDTTSVEVSLDLSIKYGGPSEGYPTKNRVPTGVFASPFSTVTIEMPDYDTSKVTICASLYLHDDLTDMKLYWYRPPVITVGEVLQPGINKIRSPYGGPLTIDIMGRDINAEPLVVTISGASPMPTFTLGETTESDWEEEIRKQPNWITIQGEHVIGLDVKAPYTKASFKQMVAMVTRYDLLVRNYYLVSGYDLSPEDPENIHAVPQGWFWWVRDSSGKNPHAGNPLVLTSWHDDDINLSLGTWLLRRFAEEFGHGMQTKCYSDVFGGETTVNIYTAFALAYFCGEEKYAKPCKELTIDLTEKYTKETMPALAAGKSYEEMYSKSAWSPLSFWIQLIQVFGYESIRNMHRRFREMIVDPTNYVCRGDKFGKFDATYEILCEMTSTDLTKHFDTYKVPLSDDVRKRVSAKKYLQPKVNISNVMVQAGLGLGWKTQPSYALPPFSSFDDAQ